MNTSKPYMLFKSITTAAKRNSDPTAFQDWITEVQNQVETNGQFTKSAAGYLPISPPPLLFDYKCAKCRFAYQPSGGPLGSFTNNGLCQIVAGDIEHNAWCVLWMPEDSVKAFSWPGELIKGDW
jgi:hypothetical protein